MSLTSPSDETKETEGCILCGNHVLCSPSTDNKMTHMLEILTKDTDTHNVYCTKANDIFVGKFKSCFSLMLWWGSVFLEKV